MNMSLSKTMHGIRNRPNQKLGQP